MKIAVYHNQLSGGAARVMAAYLEWAGRRHQMELFVPETADTGFIDLAPLVRKVHRFPIPGSEGKFGRYRRIFAVPGYGRRIAAAIDAGGFDIVFANLSYVTQAPEVLPFLKTPSVYYCPEPLRAVYDASPFPETRSFKGIAKKLFFADYDARRKRFDARAIHRATAVFTHSDFTRRVLKKIYGVEATVIHLGVDTKQFKPRGLPRERFVLSVGALHPLKGHQFVVESLAKLPAAERPPLTVVGPRGDFARRLEPYARDRGVTLTIKSGVSTEELVELYNQTAVFTAAQYNEPFGLITLEAMACETPVVAVGEGGLAETVTDEKTGLLTSRDPDAFAAAIRRVTSDPDLAGRLGRRGRRDAAKRWQWSATAEKIDELLTETAEKAGKV